LRRASRKKEKEKIMSNDPKKKKTEHPWTARVAVARKLVAP
jgi:hypothetical protein